jgi:hypothetical protein
MCWSSLDSVEIVGDVIYVGGKGADGGKFGVYETKTHKFSDLSNKLPPSWSAVKTLAYGNNQLLLGGNAVLARPGSRLAAFWPRSGEVQDLTSQLLDSNHDLFYHGLNSVIFGADTFLIGGAGYKTSLGIYFPTPKRFSSLTANIPFYFAVNTIVSDGTSFLIAGAGAGPGPGQPPAFGRLSPDGKFLNLTCLLPVGWGATWHAAYDGNAFFIHGFDRATGAIQMMALFDGRGCINVTPLFPVSLSLHSISGHNRSFLVGGQIEGHAYLARYRAGNSPSILTNRLPKGAVDVTIIKTTGDQDIIGGISQEGQIFITRLPRH